MFDHNSLWNFLNEDDVLSYYHETAHAELAAYSKHLQSAAERNVIEIICPQEIGQNHSEDDEVADVLSCLQTFYMGVNGSDYSQY